MAAKKRAVVKRKKKHEPLLVEAVISEPHYSASFDLFIYDTQEDMVNGINKWHRDNNIYDGTKNDNYIGLFVEKAKLEEREDDTFGTRLFFGTMFLCKQWLSLATIVHESLHAAVSCLRRCNRYEGSLGDNWDNGYDEEESTSYRLESYVDAIIKQCTKAKLTVKLEEEEEKKCETGK